MEIFLGVAAFLIAAWQLNLQRQEIRRSGKINTLVQLSTMVKDKIAQHDRIIADKKKNNQPWQGNAKVNNEELKPLLAKINKDLLEATSDYRCSFSRAEVERALRLQNENG